MKIMPEYLRPLTEDHIQAMLCAVQRNETVFRNVLITLADNIEEKQFLKTRSLDDIFNKYVKIEGYVTRISNYRLGPDQNDKRVSLAKNEVLIRIQTSGPSWEKKYRILEDNDIEFIENVSVSLH